MKHITYFDDYEGVVSVERLLKLNDHAHVEAVARYHWASKLLASMLATSKDTVVVWDLGCGSGEGSQIIRATEKAKSLLKVCAIDVFDRALALTTGRCTSLNINVVKQDLCAPILVGSLLSVNPANMALCFGTLPQLLHREFFFEQLVRHMRSDGTLLLNGDFNGRTACDPKPVAGYFAYNRYTLLRLLRRYFEVVLCRGSQSKPSNDTFSVADYFKDETKNTAFGSDWILCRYPIV